MVVVCSSERAAASSSASACCSGGMVLRRHESSGLSEGNIKTLNSDRDTQHGGDRQHPGKNRIIRRLRTGSKSHQPNFCQIPTADQKKDSRQRFNSLLRFSDPSGVKLQFVHVGPLTEHEGGKTHDAEKLQTGARCRAFEVSPGAQSCMFQVEIFGLDWIRLV